MGQNSGKYRVHDLNYHGKDALQQIFLNVKSKRVVERVCDMLADLHLKVGTEDLQQRKQICETLTNKCMGFLSQGYKEQNESLIEKTVLLLMLFFDKFEGNYKSRLLDANGSAKNSAGLYNYFINVNVLLKPDNVRKEVRMGIQHPMGLLKKKVAEAFDLQMKQFKLQSKVQELDSDQEDVTFREFGMTNQFYAIRIQNRDSLDQYHPKQHIFENQTYFDLLFKLLSREGGSEECHNNIWDLLNKLPTN